MFAMFQEALTLRSEKLQGLQARALVLPVGDGAGVGVGTGVGVGAGVGVGVAVGTGVGVGVAAGVGVGDAPVPGVGVGVAVVLLLNAVCPTAPQPTKPKTASDKQPANVIDTAIRNTDFITNPSRLE